MRKEKDKQTQEDDVYCVSVIIVCQHTCVRVCVYACVCVCVREREREKKKREMPFFVVNLSLKGTK